VVDPRDPGLAQYSGLNHCKTIIIKPESKKQYIEIIDRLMRSGAEGIILGCTEIELLVQAGDTMVELFPTTRIHAEAAVEKAIADVADF
jgi:aspartate racemase